MPNAFAGPSVIAAVMGEIRKMQPFAEVFPPGNIRHHFTGQEQARGVYAKELHIPAGYELISHLHEYDHLSILASGMVLWTAGDIETQAVTGPCALIVEAGVEHKLHALTDAVWFCIHPTDETDATKVDDVIIRKE
jgi:quercetin dioxygenase-like cupin family protein